MCALISTLQINEGHTASDAVLRDYCDGTCHSEHPLLAKDSNYLQIFLYYDDVEVCNAIGSKRIIHKLGKLQLQAHHSQ